MKTGLNRGRLALVAATALAFGSAGVCLADTQSGPAPKPTTDRVRTWPVVRFISTTRGARLDQISPQDLADLYVTAQISSSDVCQVVGPADVPPRSDSDDGSSKDCFDHSDTVRRYAMERPNWFSRLWSDRRIFIAGSAHITIANPDLDVTRPLFTIEHDSVRNAPDTYVTAFSASDAQAPLFRMEANTVVTVSIGESVKDDRTSAGAAALISAVQTAVNIAAPHAAVLTTLSGPDVEKTTKAIDTTIGGLLSTDKSENINLGNRLLNWSKDDNYSIIARVPDRYVKIKSTAPAGEGAADPDAATTIGHWYLWLSCPQPSIFSARDICEGGGTSDKPRQIVGDKGAGDGTVSIGEVVKVVEKQIVNDLSERPESILDTKISATTNVRDFIKTRDFYTALLQNQKRTAADTQKFCASAIDALHAQGLSQFDARLVIWAMSQNMPGIQGLGFDVVNTGVPENCQSLVGTIITLPATPAAKPVAVATAGAKHGRTGS